MEMLTLKILHRVAASRRSKDLIQNLENANGNWVQKMEVNVDKISHFFTALYTEEECMEHLLKDWIAVLSHEIKWNDKRVIVLYILGVRSRAVK